MNSLLIKKMQEQTDALLKKAKKEKKKSRERKAKVLVKLQLGMGTPTEIGIEAGNEGLDDPEGLFSTSVMPNLETNASQSSDAEDSEESEVDSEEEEEYDSDLERAHRLEESVDAMYAF